MSNNDFFFNDNTDEFKIINISDNDLICEEYDYFLSILDCDIILISQNYNNYKITHGLMKALFFSECEFVSFTKSNDELSIFMDKKSFDENILPIVNKDSFCKEYELFRVLKIYNVYCGIDEIGVVKNISSFFSDNDISILYINSKNHNYILIKKKDFDNVIKILKSQKKIKFNFI